LVTRTTITGDQLTGQSTGKKAVAKNKPSEPFESNGQRERPMNLINIMQQQKGHVTYKEEQLILFQLKKMSQRIQKVKMMTLRQYYLRSSHQLANS